ncbi:MAG: malonate transporter subunit MadL [Bacteroidetes bacterium]|nr:malonate transporter subunit MadL [Bacteroidota bacterium]
MIYGIAVLSACFLLGQLIGIWLGQWLGIDANVGGVGFAMILLILSNQWLRTRKLFTADMEGGIVFWSNLYIPVIVAMSATQNVKGAISGGWMALLAGTIPTALCVLLIPVLSRRKANDPIEKAQA